VIRALAVAALVAATTGAPPVAHAQERDEQGLPHLAVGPFVELTWRGARGELPAPEGSVPDEFRFGDGPAFGVRLHWWSTPTFGLAMQGSFGRASHCVSGDVRFCTHGQVSLWRGVAELTPKVKARVPGYFIAGGGVTWVDPDDDEEVRQLGFWAPAHAEITLTAGAGLDLRTGRRGAARVEFRWYVTLPQDQEELVPRMNSRQTDFAFGLGYVLRL
jgi:hypothetical protein